MNPAAAPSLTLESRLQVVFAGRRWSESNGHKSIRKLNVLCYAAVRVNIMKKTFLILALVSLASVAVYAEDAKPAAKTVPDKLTTCPVSGDKLGGDMGKPFVFIYKGQEVKLCCPDCKKEFDRTPDKFIAKIRAADKK